jgi:amino acid adenylation domain-containing protein
MATLIQTAGRAEVGQAVRTFYNPLLFEEETQKLPEIDEVHVWSARLTLRQGSGQVSTQNKFEVFYGTLSTDERKRAQSFVQERDRNRYIIARGILRELLGHYLGMAPEQVCLSYGANGKPHLADSLAGSGLEFNLSHAANSAVYAFANRTQVGIDIEPLNKALPWRELAPIVFSAREKAELAEIPEDEKAEAFLRGWTRKEAFVKGCGAGLSLDLNAFDVPLGWLENPCPAQLSNQQTHSPGANLHSQRPARKVKHKDVFHKQSEIWWLCPIDPIADFVAALSVNGAPLKVIANRWIDDLAWVNATATVVQQSVQVATEPMPTARACASLSVQLLCQPDVLILDELESCENEAENPPGCHTPDSLAFVIFTSGSTGMPKGAMVEYKGMFNNLITKVPTLGLTERDVIAQTAGQCFDISVWQHLTALVCGARVEIFPDEIVKEPNQLLAQLAERGITVLEAVPSMIQALMDSADETMELPKLRWLIACGEAFPPELCRRWMGRFPHVKVLNAYGPAECSDDVSYYEVPVIPGETETIVPIGRPVHNTRLYLLDRWLEPVPIGVPGEICVAGVQVGRGYLNRPDLTAEKFIPDPFDDAGTRLYRTGDLGRYREDGAIEFLGRIDHQVKIRGVRIEPGEIEAQILTFPNLEQALVIVREDSAGGKTPGGLCGMQRS